ncbi:MAG: hypothetical protein GDA51_09370 [Ekhidna sp.]|nr:hypothetical protein [Ekhidna sp.]
MNAQLNREYISFNISINQVQEIALKKIKRKLLDDELDLIRKGIECGLAFDIETVIETSIEDAVIDVG